MPLPLCSITYNYLSSTAPVPTIKFMIKCQFIHCIGINTPIFIIKIAKHCYFNYENLNNVTIFASEIKKTDTL